MATNTITRAQALAVAIERCSDIPEVAEVLTKMHTSITKPRAKDPDAKSKTRMANENYAKQVAAAISAHGDGVNTKWVAENIAGILTTQKAAAVLKVACEMGLLHKNVEGKNITYSIA